MTISVVNDQSSFYESHPIIQSNDFNLGLNKSSQISQGELPLPLSPFTESDTSSIRRESSSSYSPTLGNTPEEQQRKFSTSSLPYSVRKGSSASSIKHPTLARITTQSFDNGTIRRTSASSIPATAESIMELEADLGRGEESRRTSTSSETSLEVVEEVSVERDKSVRLSQQTVSSQTSSTGKKEGALENWKSWAKDIEARGGRTDLAVVVRDEPPLAIDPWSEYSSTTTTVTTTTTITTTTPRSIPLNASPTRASMPLPNVQISPAVPQSPHITVTTSTSNPLAPFRKKLSKSLSSGKRVSIEIQLLVELVDALESYIKSFTAYSSIRNHAPTSGLGPAENSIATGYMIEVLGLLKELIEVAPSVQKCITDGAYGPLAFPATKLNSSSSSNGTPNNSLSSPTSREDSSASTWWPRRLAKDLRKVLEEVGFPTAVALRGGSSSFIGLKSSSSSLSNRNEKSSSSVVAPGLSISIPTNTPPLITSPITSSSPMTPCTPLSPASQKRKEYLLEEGKKRWEAYRKRQQAAGRDVDTVY